MKTLELGNKLWIIYQILLDFYWYYKYSSIVVAYNNKKVEYLSSTGGPCDDGT